MSSKIMKYVLPYYLFFSFIWMILNVNYLTGLHEEGILGLTCLTTSFAGYNYVGLHGTVYALLYLLYLNEHISKYSLQYLVRMKRTRYIFGFYKKILLSSLSFTFLFISTGFIFTSIFVEKELLVTSNYYYGIIVSFLLTNLYYFFTGTLFCLLDVVFFSKIKSMIFSFIILTLLTYVPAMLGMSWAPTDVLVVFDLLFANKLYLVQTLLGFLRMAMVISFILYVTIKTFKDKDVLHEGD